MWRWILPKWNFRMFRRYDTRSQVYEYNLDAFNHEINGICFKGKIQVYFKLVTRCRFKPSTILLFMFSL